MQTQAIWDSLAFSYMGDLKRGIFKGQSGE